MFPFSYRGKTSGRLNITTLHVKLLSLSQTIVKENNAGN